MPVVCRLAIVLASLALAAEPAGATVYYVSADTGDDGDDGLTPTSAFETLGHVSTLLLQPGDEVRLLCGETWRTDPLVITRSGTPAAPIVFTAHPLGCPDRPVLSGAQPVAGWTAQGGSLYRTDLDLGANAGLFPMGINQLFRDGGRLPFGRWPNPDEGDGYATIDSTTGTTITDDLLAGADWTGAAVHVKGIRWYILNRLALAHVGSTLTLNDPIACVGTPDCAGWGYFVSSDLDTLDREGEWYWDEATNQVWLYSTLGAPADGEIEGSAIWPGQANDLPDSAAIEIGRHLVEHVAWVQIEHLRIERWHDAGLGYPRNLEADENHDIVLRDLEIVDPGAVGLRLATWVWNAAANGSGPNGWRGGRNLLVEDLVISGPNHFGIDTFAVESTFTGNVITDVGLIQNLGRTGLGCGFVGTNCTENGDGFRLRHDPDSPNHTARNVAISANRLERIGMNGIDVFGRFVTVSDNLLRDICITKGDCGAVRTFGRTSLAATPVHDVLLHGNVFDTIPGVTDGCHPSFQAQLGIGAYVDHFSRDVTITDTTVTGASWVGVLYQDSTGSIAGTTAYGNAITPWGSQLDLRDDIAPTEVVLADNVFFSIGDEERYTMTLRTLANVVASNGNAFMSPGRDLQIRVSSIGGPGLDLAGWQAASGLDTTSTEHWYAVTPPEPPRSVLLVNDTDTAQLLDPGPGAWADLDQHYVPVPVLVEPLRSIVLVEDELSIFTDGFESGNTSAWSSGA